MMLLLRGAAANIIVCVIYREIGTSGIRLSLLGLGGHEYLADGRLRGFQEDFPRAITPGHVFAGFGQEPRRRVLQLAYDNGINFYDATQDSEKEALGRNLRAMAPPFEAYVQTRPEAMMYDRDPGNRKMAEYALLKAEVERILKLMRRERLDFLNLGITPDALTDPGYLARMRSAIQRLKAEGLIRFASADTFRGEAVYLSMIASGAFDTIFINLNVGDDAGRARVIPAARAAGMAVVAREAFMKGELFKMGAEVGLTDRARLARAALRWLLAVPELTSAVVGAAEPEHLAGALDVVANPQPASADESTLERLKGSPLFQGYQAQRRRDFLEGN
jgi:aryl-alcohol dehydrogenase-like predicted oxidoreductase